MLELVFLSSAAAAWTRLPTHVPLNVTPKAATDAPQRVEPKDFQWSHDGHLSIMQEYVLHRTVHPHKALI